MGDLRFTAEACLYRSTNHYTVKGLTYRPTVTVAPSAAMASYLPPWLRSQRFWHCLASEVEYCDALDNNPYGDIFGFDRDRCYSGAITRCDILDRALPPERV